MDTYWSQFGPVQNYWHYTLGSLYLFVGVFGLAGNLLVIYFYIKYKVLRKPPNYFVINLAISDLLLLISNVPMTVISSFYGKWMFGRIGCNIYGTLGGLFGFLSISTVVFISIQKFIVINKPFFALKYNHGLTIISISIAWLYALVLIILPYFGPNGYVFEGLKTQCTFDYVSKEHVPRTLVVGMTIGGFVLPVTILVISYVLILSQLKSRNLLHIVPDIIDFSDPNSRTSQKSFYKCQAQIELDDIRRLGDGVYPQKSSISMTLSENYASSYYQTKRINLFLRSELKATKNAMIIIFLFVIAWIPYAIVAIIAQFSPNAHFFVNPYTTAFPALFAKCGSILNPIVYTLTNKQFQIKLKKNFPCLRRVFTRKTDSFIVNKCKNEASKISKIHSLA